MLDSRHTSLSHQLLLMSNRCLRPAKTVEMPSLAILEAGRLRSRSPSIASFWLQGRPWHGSLLPSGSCSKSLVFVNFMIHCLSLSVFTGQSPVYLFKIIRTSFTRVRSAVLQYHLFLSNNNCKDPAFKKMTCSVLRRGATTVSKVTKEEFFLAVGTRTAPMWKEVT